MSACERIVDFIASGPSTSAVANFQASPELKQRAAELLRREKEEGLSAAEKAELDHALELEHLLRWPRPAPADPPPERTSDW